MVDFDLVFGLAADEDSDSENILEVDTGFTKIRWRKRFRRYFLSIGERF